VLCHFFLGLYYDLDETAAKVIEVLATVPCLALHGHEAGLGDGLGHDESFP
jgi:hypothetical protein